MTQRIEIRPDHPLYGTATKLNRTRLHLDELDREIDDFIGRDLYNEDWKYNQKRLHNFNGSSVGAILRFFKIKMSKKFRDFIEIFEKARIFFLF